MIKKYKFQRYEKKKNNINLVQFLFTRFIMHINLLMARSIKLNVTKFPFYNYY